MRSAVVVCPIGFVCDHIEVLYDLDHEAARVAADIGLAFSRAEAVNDDPLFARMMTELVIGLDACHRRGRALPIVAAAPPGTEPAEKLAPRQLPR